MRLSDAGIDLLKDFEGFRAEPYLCSAGVPTNGWGHTKGVTMSTPAVTEADATTNLRQDVRSAERSVERLIKVPLEQCQFDALVSFVYNLGGGALQRSTLRQKINREEHEAVRSELAKWVWAGGKRSRGLARRRSLEADLYEDLLA